MRRSQPASQDSEGADTVATADCSRWRPVSAPQPWWAMEPCESGRRSSTNGGRRVRARTAPRMNDDASSSSQLPGGSPGGRPTAAERAEALSVIRQMKKRPSRLSCRVGGRLPSPMWWRAPSRCIVARCSNPTLMRSGSSALLRRQWFVVTGWKISLRASRRQASILQASRFQPTKLSGGCTLRRAHQ